MSIRDERSKQIADALIETIVDASPLRSGLVMIETKNGFETRIRCDDGDPQDLLKALGQVIGTITRTIIEKRGGDFDKVVDEAPEHLRGLLKDLSKSENIIVDQIRTRPEDDERKH